MAKIHNGTYVKIRAEFSDEVIVAEIETLEKIVEPDFDEQWQLEALRFLLNLDQLSKTGLVCFVVNFVVRETSDGSALFAIDIPGCDFLLWIKEDYLEQI